MARAIALLARREHSRVELRRKLRRYLAVPDRDRDADARETGGPMDVDAMEVDAVDVDAVDVGAMDVDMVDVDVGRETTDAARAVVHEGSNAADAKSARRHRLGRGASAGAGRAIGAGTHSGTNFGTGQSRPETAEDLERVLDALQEQKLLSDERFAASLVRQRSQRYGDLRLVRDLRERGVSSEGSGAAMALVRGTEVERAHAAWTRRFDALPTSAAERGRQGRYLQARGFSMTAITQVLAGKATAR